MNDILFFGVVGLYVYGIFVVSWLVAKLVKREELKTITRGAFVLVMLALPLADEIVGAYQFDTLCEEGAVLKIDEKNAQGKAVRLVVEPSDEVVSSKALLIYHSRFKFIDAKTSEDIASSNRYVAKGGWFVNAFDSSNNGRPLVIGKSRCSLDLSVNDMLATYAMTLVN